MRVCGRIRNCLLEYMFWAETCYLNIIQDVVSSNIIQEAVSINILVFSYSEPWQKKLVHAYLGSFGCFGCVFRSFWIQKIIGLFEPSDRDPEKVNLGSKLWKKLICSLLGHFWVFFGVLGLFSVHFRFQIIWDSLSPLTRSSEKIGGQNYEKVVL